MSSASVSMDVNLTISLMRGQMGAVIEKAVNVAVETVLGEMIRVVGLKFEEIKREIGAKEKENENIRRMLETSQCQMKTMRKYISVLTAKESNQRALQGAGDCMAASVGLQLRRVQTTSTALASVPSTAAKHRSSQGSPVAAGPSWARQQMTHVTLPKDAPTARSENHIVDLHLDEGHNVRVSAHKGDNSSLHLVDSQGLLSETSDPIWGQSTLTSTEPGHSEMSDSSILSETLITDESTGSKCTETFGAAFQKIKLEDGEVEIVSVKDEPTETSRSSSGIEFSNVELQQVRETEFGGPLDLPTAFQTESPGTSSDLAIPSFIGMEPISYKSNVSLRSLQNKQCSDVEKAILEAQGEMEWKINHLTTLIQNLVEGTQHPDGEEDDGVLPITSMEDLDSLELSLMDKATMQKFVRRLSISGGQTMKKTIWRICNKVFTINLAKQLNWCGRGDKRGLRRTNVGALIIAAAMRNSVLQSPTEAEAEKSIKDYLRYAPGRAASTSNPP